MTQTSQATMNELNVARHNYPIAYLSYSSFSKFHKNPGGWKEQYILHNKYFKSSPAMVVGKMAHSVVENYLNGSMTVEQSVDHAINYLGTIPDSDIKWWKTGSREKILKDFTSAWKMYFDEMPTYENVLLIEKQLTSIATDSLQGRTLSSPIPFLWIPDLVFRENGKIVIEDFKFKSSHTDTSDGIEPMYWFQSLFYYYLVKNELKEEPAEMRFREIKISKNKDNSSQHNIITINFKSEEFEFMKAHFWYQVLWFFKFIENADEDSYFPYNIYDQIDGKETFNAMQSTVFGYKMDTAKKSDLVKMEKEEFKNTKFIESNTPTSIEGKIKYKFQEFGIALEFSEKKEWYAYDRYLFIPSRWVKMSEVKKYAEDVSQATEFENVRIVAPVPWTKYVGVEVPREERWIANADKKISFPIGRDIDKKLYSLDLSNSNTPHLIVAGRSGSGKSVLLKNFIKQPSKNTIFAVIDPKRVEFWPLYRDPKNNIGLYGTNITEAVSILSHVRDEMNRRYAELEKKWLTDISETKYKRIVVLIEEMAFLMQSTEKIDEPTDAERYHKEYKIYLQKVEKQQEEMTFTIFGRRKPKKIQEPKPVKKIPASQVALSLLTEISAMGRACGIHLILATQRPSVDVIPGIIKANIPARLCFATSSAVDTKVILDGDYNAEKLSGLGDGLYIDWSGKEPIRIQTPKL